jgi:hypothetical protein
MPDWKAIAPFGWMITAAIALVALYVSRRERTNARIDRFVALYVAAASNSRLVSPLAQVISCGILQLRNDCEIREAFARIERHGHANPGAVMPVTLEGSDWYLVFKAAHEHGFDLTRFESVIMFLVSEVCPPHKFKDSSTQGNPTDEA